MAKSDWCLPAKLLLLDCKAELFGCSIAIVAAVIALALSADIYASTPIISSVSASGISSSGATVTWSTDQPSSSQVFYGITAAYGSSSPLVTSLITSHSVNLSNLSPSTTYHYQVQSADSAGNLAALADFTFITSEAGPGIPVPAGTWTMVLSKGVPEGANAWEQLVYASAVKQSIMLAIYHQFGSEANESLLGYNFDTNSWDVIDMGGLFHTENMPEGGESIGFFDFNPNNNTLIYHCCLSGSNQPENVNHTWWYDLFGQSGRDEHTSPEPPFSDLQPGGAFNPAYNVFVIEGGDSFIGTWIYNPGTNQWQKMTTNGTAPDPSAILPAVAYNSNDHKMYLFGGSNDSYPPTTYYDDLYTYDVPTNTWTLVEPTGGVKPPGRFRINFAYDSTNNIFLLYGGENASGYLGDTWVYDPVANTWTQLSPSQAPNGSFGDFARLAYDSDHNAFVFAHSANGGYFGGNWTSFALQTWLFRYKGSGPNAGTVASTAQAASGSLNRNTASWAKDPAIAASVGASFDVGWSETSSMFNQSQDEWPHIYMSQYSGGSWVPVGSSYDSISTATNEAHWPALAFSGNTLWASWYEGSNISTTQVNAKSWNGSSWQGGVVGLVGQSATQSRSQIVNIAGVPYIAYLEVDKDYDPQSAFAYARAWNGTSWVLQGGAINRSSGAGSTATSLSIATDGTFPYVAWTEYVRSFTSQGDVATIPQVYVSGWNGSQWSRLGGSLNVSSSDWAYDATVAFLAGQPYVAWTERSQTGNAQLYVSTWNGSTWTLVGSGSMNRGGVNGWSFHPSLIADPSSNSLYLAWVEQLALGGKAQVFVSKYSAGSWTSLGSSLNVEPATGSAQRVSLALSNGDPVAAWGEVNFGWLRQIYVAQWNGSTWVQLSGNGGSLGGPPDTSPPTPPTPSATPISTNQINLSWSGANDNVGVAGYFVYRGGVQIANVTSSVNYQDSALLPSTSYSYTVAAYDASGNVSSQSSAVTASTFPTEGTLTLQPPAANGEVGVSYNSSLAASGGTKPYTFSISSGSLPPGLTLNTSTGAITGTPTTAGTFNFTGTVTDSSSPPQTSNSNATITITTAAALTLQPPAANGEVGVSYNSSLAASGGTKPYTFSISSGSLPPGLTLNTSTGAITGTPTTAGTFNFTGTVTDSSSPPQTANSNATIIVSPAGTTGSVVVVQSASGFISNGKTVTVTLPQSTTVGNSLIAIAANYYNCVFNTPTDLFNNVWQKDTDQSSGTGYSEIAVWSTQISNGGSNHTITINTTNNQYYVVVVLEVSGLANPSRLDVAGSLNYQSSTTTYSASVTTSNAPDFILGIANSYNYWQVLTPASGWQLVANPEGAFNRLTVQLQSESATGTYTSMGTAPATQVIGSLAVAYKIGAASLTLQPPAANGEVGVSYNSSLAASGGTKPYTFSISSGSLPPGLTLNTSTGAITGTPTTAGTFNFTGTVTDSSSPPQTSNSNATITITTAAALTLQPPAANGEVGVSYNSSLAASGGTKPYTFSISSGSLPPGLTLNTSTGAITGTPTTAGTFNFTGTVTDSSSPPQTANSNATIIVSPAGTTGSVVVVQSASGFISNGKTVTVTLPQSTTVGNSLIAIAANYYNCVFNTPTDLFNNVWQKDTDQSSGTGYSEIAVWSTQISNGGSNHTITINTTNNQYYVVVVLEVSGLANPSRLDVAGSLNYQSSTTTYSASVTTSNAPDFILGIANSYNYWQVLTPASGWQLVANPEGAFNRLTVQLQSESATGTYTSMGTAPATQVIGSLAVAYKIGAASLTLQPPAANGEVGVSYNSSLAASGGTKPYTFSISSGSLPPGLTLNTSTGAITGTPTTAGTFNFTGTVTDSSSPPQTSNSNATITITTAAALTLQPPAANGEVGVSYNSSLAASGGTKPYTFSISSGSLPPGLTLNTSTGAITGTPTTAGTFNFTGTVTDSSSPPQTANSNATIIVSPAGTTGSVVVVQSASGFISNGKTVTVTLPQSTTVGNSLIAIAANYYNCVFNTPTDLFNNVWQKDTDQSSGTGYSEIAVWSTQISNGGSNHTITINTTNNQYYVVVVLEVSGLANPSRLDVAGSLNYQSSTTTYSASVTTSNAPDFILGIANSYNYWQVLTPASGWQLVANPEGAFNRLTVQLQSESATGTYTSMGTAPATQVIGSLAVAYKSSP